jgi:hypothetical protein
VRGIAHVMKAGGLRCSRGVGDHLGFFRGRERSRCANPMASGSKNHLIEARTSSAGSADR